MISKKFGLALIGLVFSASAFAGSCPMMMKSIDAALADEATIQELNAEQLAEVKSLRKKGEEAHKAGDHGASVQALNEATTILSGEQSEAHDH